MKIILSLTTFAKLKGYLLIFSLKIIQIRAYILIILVFVSTNVAGQIVSDFRAITRKGCAPLAVQFEDLSIGNPVKWDWDFGNGNKSTLQNPAAIYVQSGLYSVKLTVENASGQKNTKEIQAYVEVFKNPEAAIVVNPKKVCLNAPLTFNDNSLPGSGNINRYIWDFGDGVGSNLKNPSHQYTFEGYKNITLIVRDDNSCESVLSIDSLIYVYPATQLSFSNDRNLTCERPAIVSFSFDGSTAIQSILWQFGDGNTDTSLKPTHTYTNPGNYDVKITVKDKNNCIDSLTKNNAFTLGNINPSFIMQNQPVCFEQEVFFTNTTQHNLPNEPKWLWKFEDGSSSNQKNASKKFSTEGTYNIKLIAEGNGTACRDSITLPISIQFLPIPDIKPVFTDTAFCKFPTSIRFETSEPITSAFWRFTEAEGDTSRSLRPTFTYRQEGKHTLHYRFRALNGCWITDSLTQIAIENASFELEGESAGCVPKSIPYTAKLNSQFSLDSIRWLHNGTEITNQQGYAYYLNDKETGVTLDFDSTTSGIFVVHAINSRNCRFSDSLFYSFGVKTNPDFDFFDTLICVKNTVFFQNLTDTSQHQVRAVWKFTKNADTMPMWDGIYEYQELGKQTVSLITFNNTCADTITKDTIIDVKGPLAIIRTMQDPCTGHVKVVNNSEEYTRFEWYINDTISSILADSFEFTMLDVLNPKKIMLIAYNDTNDCPPDTNEVIINPVYTLNPDFSFRNLAQCTPLNIKLTNESQSLVFFLGDSYEWYINGKQIPSMFPDSMLSFYNIFPLNYNPGVEKSRSPEITITKPGTYQLTLVSNRNGCLDTLSKELNINYPMPTNYSVTWEKNCVPLKVTFKDNNPLFKRNIHLGNGEIRTNVPSTFEYVYTNASPNGYFNAVVYFTDSNGCVTWEQYRIPVVGPKIDFNFTSNTVACDNPIYQFESNLLHNPNGGGTYSWDLGDGTVKQGAKTSHIYQDSNQFNVTLSYKDLLGCEASISKTVLNDNRKPQAIVAADTTYSPCPPLVVNFKNQSISRPGIPIVSYLWEFGDGTSSTQQNPSKTYTRVGNFTVKLHIKDAAGCIHSAIISDFVVVNGPTGTYNFTPKEGCVPHQASFSVQSNHPANTFYWDLGDGETSTQQMFSKTYDKPGLYTPFLIVTDSNGCKNNLPPAGNIRVNPNPIADFNASDFCFNSPTSLQDATINLGIPIKQWVWKMEDAIALEQNPKHSFSKPGYHQVSLIVRSNTDCFDTATKYIKIYGFDPQIKADSNQICLGEDMLFSNTSKSDTSLLLNNTKWIYNGDTVGNGNNFIYQPTQKGWVNMGIYLQNVLGCDTFKQLDKTLLVGDTLPPPHLNLLHVSVLDDERLQIKFNASQEPDFYSYHLYKKDQDGNPIWLNQHPRLSDTLMVASQLNPLHNVYCFTVVQENICALKANPQYGDWHCSVELSGESDTNRSILHWNPYHGWNEVERYVIFKQQPDNPLQFDSIGQVPGDIYTYIDSVDCFTDLFSYRVKAIEKNGYFERAWSDTCRVKPVYFPVVHSPYFLVASVPDNQSVSAKITQIQESRKPIQFYKVERAVNQNLYRFVDTVQTTLPTSIFYDKSKNIDVQKQSYYYRVRAVDECLDESTPSNFGKTILLKTSINEAFKPVLTWTPYLYWEESVDYYIVEKELTDGSFQKIGQTINGFDTSFVDENLEINCAQTYRYRVIGVRAEANNQSIVPYKDIVSISNISDVPVESRLYTPNAFSPNNDGLNEVLEVKGVFIKSFYMEVFNRWGEKLFESNDCYPTWDATFNGIPVPNGVYIYKIQAIGADGKLHSVAKDVTILR